MKREIKLFKFSNHDYIIIIEKIVDRKKKSWNSLESGFARKASNSS